MLSLNRQILRLSAPNIVSNITVPLLGLVDLAMMGHLDDPVYIGAIALGGAIFNLIYMSFGFLRMGTTGFTAQAFGAKLKNEITLVLYRSLLVALLIAIILIVLQYPIQWIAFQLLDGSIEVKTLAREYFYIRIFAAPATLGLYALHGWFLGMQNAKIPMVLAILINSLNILFQLHLHHRFWDESGWSCLCKSYCSIFRTGCFYYLYPDEIQSIPYTFYQQGSVPGKCTQKVLYSKL